MVELRRCLFGLDNGDLLLIGGETEYDGMISFVWRLRDGYWSQSHSLLKSFAYGSIIKIEDQIYSFGGESRDHEDHPILRTDLENNTPWIENQSLIGNQVQYYPILFQTDRNACIIN